ncbi:MAG: hypothetical protein MK066_05360 [Crocinitomicaceae bacterium]|nr:hypothetical protein [Crocinitomicaceae bacterium]
MKALPFFAALLLVITFSSCKQTKQAGIVADQFYEFLMQKNYDGAIELIHSDALMITAKDDWLQLLQNKESIGKMKSFERNMGVNTKINNGVTTVSLNYTTTYGDTEFKDEIILRNEGKDFKVYGYSTNAKY